MTQFRWLLLALVGLAACAGSEDGDAPMDTRDATAEATVDLGPTPDDGLGDAPPADTPGQPDAQDTSDAYPDGDAGIPQACPGADASAGGLVVAPYLQRADPHAVTIRWSTDTGAESRIEWGESEALGLRACGRIETTVLGPPGVLHHVRLTELEPGTTYWYRAHSGDLQSEIYAFRTPPEPNTEASFRFVSMSDMQRDDAHPDKFHEIID